MSNNRMAIQGAASGIFSICGFIAIALMWRKPKPVNPT